MNKCVGNGTKQFQNWSWTPLKGRPPFPWILHCGGECHMSVWPSQGSQAFGQTFLWVCSQWHLWMRCTSGMHRRSKFDGSLWSAGPPTVPWWESNSGIRQDLWQAVGWDIVSSSWQMWLKHYLCLRFNPAALRLKLSLDPGPPASPWRILCLSVFTITWANSFLYPAGCVSLEQPD